MPLQRSGHPTGKTGKPFMFQLHPRLEADTLAICQLTLCEVRLMDDRRFPWLILVPRRVQITELHQLMPDDQQQLMIESSLASRVLELNFSLDKINVAALGNVVSQLHWHVVARRTDDPCWPGPVWGCGERQPYQADAKSALITTLQSGFNDV